MNIGDIARRDGRYRETISPLLKRKMGGIEMRLRPEIVVGRITDD